MIEVELPDGSIAEFPPGTSQEAIRAAVQKRFPPKQRSMEELGLASRGPTIEKAAQAAAAKMGPLRQTLYGAERVLDEAALGAKQLITGLTPEDEAGLKLRRATEKAAPYAGLGRVGGDILAALPVAGAANALAQRIPAMATIPGRLATAGATGAAIAGVQPVLEDESRASNMVRGAAFTTLGQVGGDVVGSLIRGAVPKNPSVAKLPQNVQDRMSLGQVADRKSLAGQIASSTEEKLQSIPLVGNMIRNRRQNATDAWRDDLVESTAPKGFVPAGDNTWEKLNSSSSEFTRRYVDALRNYQVPPSRLFESQVLNITNNPRSGLTSGAQQEVRDLVMNYYRSMMHGNNIPTPAGTGVVIQGGQRGTPISIDAKNAKDFEAFLTSKAAQYRRGQSPGDSDKAKMFEDLERAWSVSYRRALPSSARKSIKELDQQYAPFKTVERAAGSVANDFGDFTPQQMLNAVRQRTPQSRYSRGGGILQQEAGAARDTLIDRVPNSGTADRAMTVGAIGGLVADPATAIATFLGAIPVTSTKVGRNIATGDTKVQEILKLLRADKAAQRAGLPGGLVLQDLAADRYSE